MIRLPELVMPDLDFARQHIQHIARVMDQFQAAIGPDKEVGIRVAFGGEPVYMTAPPTHSGNAVLFIGETAAGEPAIFMQHFMQAAVLLVALPRRPGRQRVGFEAP